MLYELGNQRLIFLCKEKFKILKLIIYSYNQDQNYNRL